MAARTRRGVNKLPDDWKQRIKLAQIINRLNDCAIGEVEMQADQLQAAKLLLNKLIPDLARTEHTGEDGGPVVYAHTDKVKERLLAAIPQEQLDKILADVEQSQHQSTH